MSAYTLPEERETFKGLRPQGLMPRPTGDDPNITHILIMMPRAASRSLWGTLREGRCRKCGYDLRASKEHCPECGTAIA